MDKFKKYATTLVFIIVLSLFAVMRGPSFYNNWKWEGEKLETFKVYSYNTGKEENLFEKNQKFVLMFWASWCGPCMVEFSRYKASIENNKIPATAVYAMNPFETSESIQRFMAKNKYPFQFVSDGGELARTLDIRVTPTSLIVHNQEILKMDSGVSPLGVTTAESVLSD